MASSTGAAYIQAMADSVTILYFSWLRERLGLRSETIPLPPGIETVGALIEHLRGRGAAFAEAFAGQRTVRCAVNQEFAGLGEKVAPGDEVAFFPPVTGG